MELNKSKNIERVRQLSLLIILLLEIVLFTLLSDRFFRFSNAISILRQVSVTGISAMGLFMIILLGDIELSVGAMYAFIGVVSALIFRAPQSAALATVAALGMGTLIGLVNGVITAKFKIPAFITTLAMMSVCSGFAYIITKGTPIGVTDPSFTLLGSGYIAGVIPLPIIFMLIVLALGWFMMYKARFGRHIYACGGNAQAAKWSGINADRIKIIVFTIAGFLNGFAAIVLAGRLGGGLPSAGDGSELDVIPAVVLGGTSSSGGRGKLWGVVLGVLIIGVLTVGLTMIGVSTYWQKVIKGVIIVVAVIIDTKGSKSA